MWNCFGSFCWSRRAGQCQALLIILLVQGRLSIPFRDITRNKRIKDNYSLHGVRRGQLTVSYSWLGISDAKWHHGSRVAYVGDIDRVQHLLRPGFQCELYQGCCSEGWPWARWFVLQYLQHCSIKTMAADIAMVPMPAVHCFSGFRLCFYVFSACLQNFVEKIELWFEITSLKK